MTARSHPLSGFSWNYNDVPDWAFVVCPSCDAVAIVVQADPKAICRSCQREREEAICISKDEDGVETIGEHEWVEYEARVILDSRTYAFRGTMFTWRCIHCPATRKSPTLPGTALGGQRQIGA